jgi:hypothetical protein
MSDMAEVLAAHWSRSTHTDSEPFVDKCDGCGAAIYTWGNEQTPGGIEPLAAHQAEMLTAAGYRKPRTIATPDEANALPDRSAFLTPGGIIFRKWEGYYGEGKDAWERELGKVVPAELLSAEGHFPAAVLYTPEAA